MRRLAAACALALALAHPACASVVVHIDKSSQRMSVSVDGSQRYTWAVSTGRRGYGTPSGTFRPQRLERTWFSKKYYDSPMPYSIFFHGGFAIHGSYDIRRLGGPASHGCVRLHPRNAATLYALVRRQMGATRIVVSGSPPGARAYARRLSHRRTASPRAYDHGAVVRPYGGSQYWGPS